MAVCVEFGVPCFSRDSSLEVALAIGDPSLFEMCAADCEVLMR